MGLMQAFDRALDDFTAALPGDTPHDPWSRRSVEAERGGTER
jgi:hypothetical protein